jgi:hypothetical protein
MPKSKRKFLNKKVAQEAVRLAAVEAKNENPRASFPAVFLSFMDGPELLSELPKSKTPLKIYDSLKLDDLQLGVTVSREASDRDIANKARDVNFAVVRLYDAIAEYHDVNQPGNDADFVEGKRKLILVELKNVLSIGKTKKEINDLGFPLRNADWVPQLMAVFDKFQEVRKNSELAILSVDFNNLGITKRTQAEQEQVEAKEEKKMEKQDDDLFGFSKAKDVKLQDRSARSRNNSATTPPAKDEKEEQRLSDLQRSLLGGDAPANPAPAPAKPGPAKPDIQGILRSQSAGFLARSAQRAAQQTPNSAPLNKEPPKAVNRTGQVAPAPDDDAPEKGIPLKTAGARTPAPNVTSINVGAAKPQPEPPQPTTNTFTATTLNQPSGTPAARRMPRLNPITNAAPAPAAGQKASGAFVNQRISDIANENKASDAAAAAMKDAALKEANDAAAARARIDATTNSSPSNEAKAAKSEAVKSIPGAVNARIAKIEAQLAAERAAAAKLADSAVAQEQKSPLTKDSLSNEAKTAKDATVSAIPKAGAEGSVSSRVAKIEAGLKAEREAAAKAAAEHAAAAERAAAARAEAQRVAAAQAEAQRAAAAQAEAQRVAAAQAEAIRAAAAQAAAAQAAADRAASAAIREQKASVLAQLKQRTAQRSAEQGENKAIQGELKNLRNAGVVSKQKALFEQKIQEERARQQQANESKGQDVNPENTGNTEFKRPPPLTIPKQRADQITNNTAEIDYDNLGNLYQEEKKPNPPPKEEVEVDYDNVGDLFNEPAPENKGPNPAPTEEEIDYDNIGDLFKKPEKPETEVDYENLEDLFNEPASEDKGPNPAPTEEEIDYDNIGDLFKKPEKPEAEVDYENLEDLFNDETKDDEPDPNPNPNPSPVFKRPPPLVIPRGNRDQITKNEIDIDYDNIKDLFADPETKPDPTPAGTTTTASSVIAPTTTPAGSTTTSPTTPLPPVQQAEPPQLLKNWTKELANDVIKLARAANDSTALSRTQSQLEHIRLKALEFNNANFENLAEREKLKQQWLESIAPLAQKIAENTSRLIVSRDNMPNCIAFLKQQSWSRMKTSEAESLLTKSQTNVATYEKMWEQLESIKQSVQITSQADYTDRVRFTASKIIKFDVDPANLNASQATIQQHLQDMNNSIGSNANVANGKLALSTFTKEEAKVNVSNEMAIMAIKGWDSSGINGGSFTLSKPETSLDLNTVIGAGPINNRGDIGISIYQMREDISAPHILAKIVMDGTSKLQNLTQFFPLSDPGNAAQTKKELIQMFQQELPSTPSYSDVKSLLSRLPPGQSQLNSWFSPNVSQVASVMHETMAKTLKGSNIDAMLLAQDMVEKARAISGGKVLIIEEGCPPEVAKCVRMYCEAKMKEIKDPNVRMTYDYFDPKDIKGALRREALKEFTINPFKIYEKISENRKISAAVSVLKSQDVLTTPKLKEVTYKDQTKLDNIYLKSDRDNRNVNKLQRSLDTIKSKVDNLSRADDIKTEIDKQVALGPPKRRP